jgi:hypothetical protein
MIYSSIVRINFELPIKIFFLPLITQ